MPSVALALAVLAGSLACAFLAAVITTAIADALGWTGTGRRWKALSTVLYVTLCTGVVLGGSACHVAAPLLGDVLSRLSADDAIACASRPSAEAKAQCLGVQAMNAGLSVALDRAAELADAALDAASGQGAEVSDEDRDALAVQLDAALDDLAHEISVAQ